VSGVLKPDVSLVIAVYERADALEMVLVSLLNQSFARFEIVVADDGSGPGIAEVIDRYTDQFAHPIRRIWHEDEGFRKTIIVNRAVTRTEGEYLVFVDGDCLLHHRFLERHVRRRRRGEVLSGRRVMFDRALTGKVTVEDVRKRRVERIGYWWRHAGKIDRWNGFYFPFLHGIRNIGQRQYQILGSNFSVHKTDFYQVNGYDERIVGRGLEDNNLCVRFINSGMIVRTITREALQYHLYHTADPMPHDGAFIEEYRSSGETRTPYGIVKD
jgi:glycosyltransferase involved in cell wall biosynthesis